MIETMSRASFTQADVSRALKGAKQAGYAVSRAVINRAGDIVLEFGDMPDEVPAKRNPWDEVLSHAEDEERSS
jgi:hypothetical protein